MEAIPTKVLQATTKQERLVVILSTYDPDNYKTAVTEYRAPSYQRGLKKRVPWCIKLVESILENKCIGSITLSKWSEMKSQADGPEIPVRWSNVEDGLSRLKACVRFRKEEFVTKYGGYADVQETFDNYMLGIIEIKKYNEATTDKEFFAALLQNFSLLQEGTPLSSADRYWAQMAADSQGFRGSALVNFTLEMVDEMFPSRFHKYCGVSKDWKKTSKSKIVDLVAICSGCMDASKCSGTFFAHCEMMHIDYEIPDRDEAIRRLTLFFHALDEVYKVMSLRNKETTNHFLKPQPFVSAMFLHIENGVNDKLFVGTWVPFFNKCRSLKQKRLTTFIDEIFNGLKNSEKHNCDGARLRLERIIQWNNKRRFF